MASAAQPNRPFGPTTLPGPRFDRIFFSGMAMLLLATVLAGFAPTYYLAGIVPAPDPATLQLPSAIIRVHAAIYTVWLLLFAAQVALVARRRVGLHRRLGLAGIPLVCGMVVTGLMAGADTLSRNVPPGLAELLFIVNVSMVAVFAALIAVAYRLRNTPPAHKRLVLAANIALLFAPLIRIPAAGLYHNIPAATRASYLFLLPIFLYDLWRARKIHPATLWSSVFLVFVYEVRVPIAGTAAWHAISAWVRAR